MKYTVIVRALVNYLCELLLVAGLTKRKYRPGNFLENLCKQQNHAVFTTRVGDTLHGFAIILLYNNGILLRKTYQLASRQEVTGW